MILRTVITIPQDSTIADVVGVKDFLTGLGSCEVDLNAMKIVAEFEPLDQPVMDISAAIVNHTTQEIGAALRGNFQGAQARIKEAISAGLGLLDRWDEVLTEVQSRGWDRPAWEIRA